LEGRDGEVADSNELQRVLDDVEDGWDGELPAVWAEDFSAKGPEGGCPWPRERPYRSQHRFAVPRFFSDLGYPREGDEEGYRALEKFVEENCGGWRVG
jgi:hypothetical protein